MALNINLIKSGINYVLKSSKNVVPRRLSVFAEVESPFAKNAQKVAEIKPPFKPEVTNPFSKLSRVADAPVSSALQSSPVINKNGDAIIKFLDGYEKSIFAQKAKNIKEIILQNPEILNTFPQKHADMSILSLLSTNPSAWKPEYASLPLDKIKSPQISKNYLVSLLKDSNQAVHRFDTKLMRHHLGVDGATGSIAVFDFSALKTSQGKYDPKKLAQFLENIKSEQNPDQSIKYLQNFVNKFESIDELAQKHTDSLGFLFDHYLEGCTYRCNSFAMCLDDASLTKIDNLLSSGIKLTSNDTETLTGLLATSDYFDKIASNSAFTSLTPELKFKAARNLRKYSSDYYSNFKNYDKDFQDRIIATSLKIPQENAVYFNSFVQRYNDKDLLVKVLDKSELLSDIEKNKKILNNIFGVKNNTNSTSKSAIINQLAIMKTFYPEEYYSLAKTEGFEAIKSGYLDIGILNGVRYNSGDEFFNNIYGKIEKLVTSSKGYQELEPQMQKLFMEIIDNDPVNAKDFVNMLEKAKNKTLMLKGIATARNASKRLKTTIEKTKTGESYIHPADATKARKDIYKFLQLTSNQPENMEFALHFQGKVADFNALSENFAKYGNKVPTKVNDLLYANRGTFKANDVSAIYTYLGKDGDPQLVNKLLTRTATLKNLTPAQMTYILNNTSKNNVDFLLHPENLLKQMNIPEFTNLDLQIIAYATKDLKAFKDSANQVSILRSIGEISSFSKNIGESINVDALTNLLALKTNYPEKYKELQSTGIFDYIKSTGEELGILRHYNENSTLSKSMISDLKLWKEGKSIVPSFSAGTSLDEVFAKTKIGDAVEVGNKMYINDGKQMYEWSMTKDKFLELFPPVKRFSTMQGRSGDCYLVSSLNAMMQNPNARTKLYKSFELDGNDIKVTLDLYKDFKGTVTFKDGIINLDSQNKHLTGCKGVMMLEQSYARTALRKQHQDHLTSALDNSTLRLMTRIRSGQSRHVNSEILGIPNSWEYSKLPENIENNSISVVGKDGLEEALEKYANNEGYVMNWGTPSRTNSPSESTIESSYSLVSNHTYSLLGYDKTSQMVTISNPHNAGLNVNIPLETLKKFTSDYQIASLA